VSEDTPDYSDIIENPMDFGTMKKKISDASYSSGSEGIAQVYGDFLLVMDNCALYNDDNKEILTEAGRLLGLLPKFFMKACVLMKGN
jgi:bromodomain-containing protein 7/9